MGDDADPGIEPDPPDEPLTMAAALSGIAHETRVRIVLELGDYSDGPTDLSGLGYTELMERVGAEDSGRFNYHLDELVGGLVEKSDGEYWLAVSGHLLYQSLVAGTLTGEASTPSLALDADCEDCGGPLRASYGADQILVVRCDGCERVHQHLEFPARGIEGRSPEAAVDAAVRYFNTQFAALRRGVCPACAGRVEAALRLPEEAGLLADLSPDEDAFATLGCLACSLERIGSPAAVALTTPPVVGFFDAHGRDPYAVPLYRLSEHVREVTVHEDPPVTAVVTFELDGDRRRVTLDETLSVVDDERP